MKNWLLCELEHGGIITTEYSENRKGQTDIVIVFPSLDKKTGFIHTEADINLIKPEKDKVVSNPWPDVVCARMRGINIHRYCNMVLTDKMFAHMPKRNIYASTGWLWNQCSPLRDRGFLLHAILNVFFSFEDHLRWDSHVPAGGRCAISEKHPLAQLVPSFE